jgi:hypothetical protein
MITDSDLATLQAQIAGLQKRVNDFETRPMTQNPLVAPFLNLPGQVGLWAAGVTQRSTGNLYDLSGQGRALTYNGNPAINLQNNFVPFYNLDGTGDFFSRADETDLDILGTEAIFGSAIRGLTMGCWFQFDSVASSTNIFLKAGAAGTRSYQMFQNAPALTFRVSADGTNFVGATGPNLSTGVWYFLWGRYSPSTYIDAGINLPIASNYVRNTTSIPASIFNGTAPLELGGSSAGNSTDGRFALAFLCATVLSDEWLAHLFNSTRGLFGV